MVELVEKTKPNKFSTIAQWIRLHLPSCHHGFESQAHHLSFHQFIELYNVEKTKINKQRPGLAHLKNKFTDNQ